MKIEKKHNNETKELFQKIMLFIDSTLLNAVISKPEDTNRVLVSGLQNIKDVILSELIKDNFTLKVNEIISDHFKKKEQSLEKNLSQETRLEKDQSV